MGTILKKLPKNAEALGNTHYSENTEMEPVEQTPFHIVRTEADWFVVIGKYRVSDRHDTKEEALKDAKTIDWNKIITVMTVILENKENNK